MSLACTLLRVPRAVHGCTSGVEVRSRHRRTDSVLALEIEGVVEDGRNTFVLLVTAIVMHCAVI